MNEEDQQEMEENNEAEEPREEKLRYDFVPYDRSSEEDLYSFREALKSPNRPQVPIDSEGNAVLPPAKARPKILIPLVAVGCLVLVTFIIYSLEQGPPPPPYVNLGQTNLADSGLSGDFVARWTGKAGYIFYVNPRSADDLAAFAAVAENPPSQIAFTIHLKDGSGVTVCEKEIVLPFKAPVDGSAVPTQGPPERTMEGEEISYDRAEKGQIARIEIKGSMNCDKDFYQRIAAWDFTTTYPAKGEQEDWLANLEHGGVKGQSASNRKRPAPAAQKLSAPIDGDDVIVGDNRTRGTVLTRSGREFFVGPGGLSSHGEGWGFFPAAIHVHCDVKANCTLTRPGAANAVQARLMK